MTNPGTKPSRFNLMQRLIQSVFGTREFAVVALITFCALAEVCILIATQRYESLTAPPGTVLFWGMSAAGMVIFFAEVLKLPVAWVSGVVSGKRMIVLNLVTAGLCMLTTLTIKDLVIWEWDESLKPARKLRAESKLLFAEIDALERKSVDISQNSKEAQELRETKINTAKRLLDDQVRRRTEVLAQSREQLTALNAELLDPKVQNQIAALQRALEDELASFQRDIEAEQKQRDMQLQQIAEGLRKGSSARGIEITTYLDQKKEYEAARRRVEMDRDAKIAALGKDTWFSNVGPETDRIRREAQTELERLEREFRLIKPPTGLVGNDANGDATPDPQIANIEKRIKDLQERRDAVRTARQDEINKLYAQSNSDARINSSEIARKRADIEKDLADRLMIFDKNIHTYEDEIAALAAEKTAVARTPQQIEAERQAIAEKLPPMKKKAEQLASESEKLAKDTNAFRAANGVIRWVMPGASTERLEEVAYGVFPAAIGLLVACLPALLLEIGVYCIRPEVRRSEQPRPSLFTRLSRGRKVLQTLQARARTRMDAAAAAEREFMLRHQNVELEHASRLANLEREIEQRITTSLAEVQQAQANLENELRTARSREMELGRQISETTQQLAKMGEDNRRLAAHVVLLDANTRQTG
jgi:hypothetical protein